MSLRQRVLPQTVMFLTCILLAPVSNHGRASIVNENQIKEELLRGDR
jgi:hypothetical protein